jgi:hypothetical protein
VLNAALGLSSGNSIKATLHFNRGKDSIAYAGK